MQNYKKIVNCEWKKCIIQKLFITLHRQRVVDEPQSTMDNELLMNRTLHYISIIESVKRDSWPRPSSNHHPPLSAPSLLVLQSFSASRSGIRPQKRWATVGWGREQKGSVGLGEGMKKEAYGAGEKNRPLRMGVKGVCGGLCLSGVGWQMGWWIAGVVAYFGFR